MCTTAYSNKIADFFTGLLTKKQNQEVLSRLNEADSCIQDGGQTYEANDDANDRDAGALLCTAVDSKCSRRDSDISIKRSRFPL